MARIHKMFPEYFAKARQQHRNQLYRETRRMQLINQKKMMQPWYYDFILPSVLLGIVSIFIGLFILTIETGCGLLLLLVSIIFFLPAYWVYIKKPQNIRREQEETRIRHQEDERRHQEDLRIKYGDLFLSVVDAIKAFKPLLPDYPNELSYHIDIARWLEPKFPMLKVEFQQGSARPDIVIEDIAIEIKGPTTEQGLQSIADKCLRYHHHFNKMIVVLFDVQTKTSRFFYEWEEGMKKNFPDVVVIKK